MRKAESGAVKEIDVLTYLSVIYISKVSATAKETGLFSAKQICVMVTEAYCFEQTDRQIDRQTININFLSNKKISIQTDTYYSSYSIKSVLHRHTDFFYIILMW